MRILLLSRSDLFGSAILNTLLPALYADNQIAVCLSDKIFENERGFPATDQFMHYTHDLPMSEFFPAIDALEQDDAAKLLTFTGLAKRFDAAFTYLGGNSTSAVKNIERIASEFHPDAILCCRHDFIIPSRIFLCARFGAYNLHSGAVPYYRGPFCSFWSMFKREPKMGCSLHSLKEKVDTGDIVGTAWRNVDYSSTLVWNLLQIYIAGAELFLELMPRLALGPLPGLPQPEGIGAYFPQPNADDYEEFFRRQIRLVEAEECHNLLKGYIPPGMELEQLVPQWRWEDA